MPTLFALSYLQRFIYWRPRASRWQRVTRKIWIVFMVDVPGEEA